MEARTRLTRGMRRMKRRKVTRRREMRRKRRMIGRRKEILITDRAIAEVEAAEAAAAGIAAGVAGIALAHLIGPDIRVRLQTKVRLNDCGKRPVKRQWLAWARSTPKDPPQLRVRCGVEVEEMFASLCLAPNIVVVQVPDP